MNFETLHKFDTEYSADSIEWCLQNEHLEYFVCGTYELEQSKDETNDTKRKRKGRIYLFKYEKYNDKLIEVQRIDCDAVLDMKWRPNKYDRPTLGVATSLGEVLIYIMEDFQLCLQTRRKIGVTSDCLALSIDWSNEIENEISKLLVSDSTGGISLLKYESSELKDLQTWKAHEYEAWTCAFDKWNKNYVYSGGDDCLLRIYDIRASTHMLTNKSHNAGVTSLLSHPNYEYKLLTGSYDENLRIFDTRSMKTPLNSLQLNGGIWRIRSHDIAPEMLLVACMYENFSIVNFNNDLNEFDLKGVYNEHESICYGADWCLQNKKDDDYFNFSTCSFYDHKLCVVKVIKN